MSQPAVPSTTLTTPSPKKQASAGKKKHRSVKSLTREYETNSSNTGGIPTSASSSSALSSASSAATPTALTPSSSATTAFPSSPTTAERGLSPQTSETSLSISRDRSNSQSSPSHQHLRKASAVLLASPTYPSTLNLEDHTRPRTLSSSSQYSAHDKSESSVRLASRGYPSSYMPVQAQNQAQPQQAENGALGLTRDTMSAAAAKPKDGKGAQAMLRMHRRKESKEALERERQANLASAHAEGSSSSSNGIPTLSISSEDVTQTHPSRDNSLISTSSSHEEEEELYEGLDSVGDLNSNTVNSGSSEKPFSQMTPAERREHSRRHSRVHSRNLSVFFPRPGTDAEKEADEEQARQNYLLPSSPPEQSTAHSHAAHSHLQGALSPPQMQHSESLERRASGASFVSATSSSSGSTTVGTEDMQRSMSSKSRRGHHHRHSVNFAVYDSPQMAVSTSAVGHSHHNHAHDAHERHHHEHAHTHDHAAHAHDHARSHTVNAADSFSALLSKFPPLPPSARPTLLFGSLHFALGAALWVSGQAGDSLALTGLGYLVVFDAFGVLSEVGSKMAAESWRRELDQRYKGGRTSGKTSTEQIRRPFGPHRFETILHFSQSIYLLFSGVYVLKESIEHALLEGSEEHEEAEIGLVLPVGLLMLATAACIFSNITLKNHAKLVAACGISTAASSAQNQYAGNRHARHKSVLTNPTTIAGPFLGLLANPFSLTVLFFSASLLFSAILMPPFQVAALDKVLAGMESVSMFCIAWPASKALGLVLLQTAPLSSAPQYVQLVKALQVLEEHPLVTYIAPPRIWQLTPSTSSTTSADDASRKNNSFANLTQSASRAPALIATVHIFLQDSASDDDLQAVKKLAWERLAASVGAAAGLRAGESLRGGRRAGEITIAVEREGKRDHYLSQLDHSGHHHHDGHDHHHDHACDHGHDHAHEHAGHSHSHAGHAHSHDSHSHSHAPAQAQKHSHQHAHESSHAHHGHSHHDHH